MELRERFEAWNEALSPTGAVEQSLVHDAVQFTWQVDRARHAQVARIEFNIENNGRDDAQRQADEVLYLGQLLFVDRRGPLNLFPHFDRTRATNPDAVSRISSAPLEVEPSDPPRLVLRLESTLVGCQWLLDQWAELRSILDEGRKWLPADKLKATRLLGRQPMDAVSDRRVLLIFAACQAVEECPGTTIPEIFWELGFIERKPYAKHLADRGLDELTPKDPASGRQVLLGIVDQATQAIQIKADDHRRHAEVNAALLGDCLSFDDSQEGERLRRYELAATRGVARSLDTLLKLRRKGAQVDQAKPAEMSLFAGGIASAEKPEGAGDARREASNGCDCETSEAPGVTTTEPAVEVQNATTEPISASKTGMADPVEVEQASTADAPNSTIEPDCAGEIETSNANDGESLPAAAVENATTEPISAGEPQVTEAAEFGHAPAAEMKNATNEANCTGVVPENGGPAPGQVERHCQPAARAFAEREMASGAEAQDVEKPDNLPLRVPDALLKDALALQWLPGTLVQEILEAAREERAPRPGGSARFRADDS